MSLYNEEDYRPLAISNLAGAGVGYDDDGNMVLDGGAAMPDESAVEAEIARIKAEEEAKALEQDAKFVGIAINSVMCSATDADQNGLVAVYVDYMNDPANFSDTVFEFANGSEITITQANIAQIKTEWTVFRRGFFSG